MVESQGLGGVESQAFEEWRGNRGLGEEIRGFEEVYQSQRLGEEILEFVGCQLRHVGNLEFVEEYQLRHVGNLEFVEEYQLRLVENLELEEGNLGLEGGNQRCEVVHLLAPVVVAPIASSAWQYVCSNSAHSFGLGGPSTLRVY